MVSRQGAEVRNVIGSGRKCGYSVYCFEQILGQARQDIKQFISQECGARLGDGSKSNLRCLGDVERGAFVQQAPAPVWLALLRQSAKFTADYLLLQAYLTKTA